ncbi:hypothetical protein TSUD_00940 [Trifolium subterraneum]|nr:hypothetical protein TSUD_00940 [Trifolium subterraneum]
MALGSLKGFVWLLLITCMIGISSAQLSNEMFYARTCPKALRTIRKTVHDVVKNEKRMGASLLRLFFHDCFVQLGGARWNVPLGRRDSLTASLEQSNSDLPAPFLDLDGLIAAFNKKNFTAEEMVTLSGAHTVGQVRCFLFRARVYNETNIDPTFAAAMQAACPFEGGDDNLSPFDSSTPTNFDNDFYGNLVESKGLVHSDQQLFGNGTSTTSAQVRTYSRNMGRFKKDFADAMFKMTLLNPLTGTDGEIRQNCRVINAPSNTTTTV